MLFVQQLTSTNRRAERAQKEKGRDPPLRRLAEAAKEKKVKKVRGGETGRRASKRERERERERENY